ncbi:glycoside hydrolase family 2 protein [Pontiella agarivorans]|uniref:Glycoside hydrolase family 2 TIM barrel-domain containing protein n=1 Tax=Pontiella agarivorans TaxID=3038953 RepID=A0ABU5MXT4_9BACT|nr:sugar-binding domain-containing protein [Pontiella agarivorans]MDZ8118781.1 glycoside hydrolase family 2 TIM barrel-domain containing protein [Pontiella agarivorans]
MMKLYLILGVVAVVSLSGRAEQPVYSTAGFYAVEGTPRSVQNFNPGWRFHKGDVKGAEAVDFDDQEWEAANLPHGLEITGENASGGRNYQGKAWYRKKFDVSKRSKHGKVYLYFEAVMGEAQVWVNGQHVAEHFGGYLPFAIDITEWAKPAGNVVAVMADNSDSTLYPPGKKQSGLDFSYHGGIYRDTYLIQTSPVHVTLRELSDTVAGGGVFPATLSVTGNDAEIEVRTEVINESSRPLDIEVCNFLEDSEGRRVAELRQSLRLKGGETRQLAKQASLNDVKLWHPDDPNLHFVRTEIRVGGQVVDGLKTRFGVRKFEMKPDGFYVNGKPFGRKIVGANRHQDYNYVGNALPNSGQWRDALLLRRGGCSVIRAAHYPMDPAFYDACDYYGILTTTANPGWHFFNFKQKIFEERLFEDTRQLVRRDRNVASMLLWETCINEFPQQPDYAMNTMHKITHAEYPFPSVFTVADHHEAEKGGFDFHYNCDGKDHNSFHREYGDGGEVDNWYSQNARQRIKREWGENAMVRQSRIQEVALAHTFGSLPAKIGGTMWAGIDHQRGYHPDPFRGGHLDGFRIPRYTHYLYMSQYDPDYNIPHLGEQPMIKIAHEHTQVSGADVVIYSNCDEVRLTICGEDKGTRQPERSGALKDLPHPPFVFENAYDWQVVKKHRDGASKFKDVDIVAEGLIDGRVVVTQVVPYAQRTTGIALSLDGVGVDLVADGSDFIPVRATVVDQYGSPKVLASEYIHFVVEGEGEIIGDSTTYANPKKTEFGVATALIRSTVKPGKITVKAYSKGLEPAEMTFESRPAELPMAFDQVYTAASKKPKSGNALIITAGASDLPADVKELQKRVQKLELEAVGKDQTIMELQSQIGRKGE